ncbi:MAG: hypothetical protein KF723_21735 [Rhizobiaceae bacterium]|nr:hypothetical protein [Rhizobiaceae bacterium]
MRALLALAVCAALSFIPAQATAAKSSAEKDGSKITCEGCCEARVENGQLICAMTAPKGTCSCISITEIPVPGKAAIRKHVAPKNFSPVLKAD